MFFLSPELVADIHHFLDRNELERSQLVNRMWWCLVSGDIFKQRRIFDTLCIQAYTVGTIENENFLRYIQAYKYYYFIDMQDLDQVKRELEQVK